MSNIVKKFKKLDPKNCQNIGISTKIILKRNTSQNRERTKVGTTPKKGPTLEQSYNEQSYPKYGVESTQSKNDYNNKYMREEVEVGDELITKQQY